MNILLSIIYAPLVFFSLRYFDITLVSILIFLVSLIWFFIVVRKNKKEALYPFVYLFIAVVTFFLKDFLILKSIPLLISIFITALMIISYINKNSIILYFALKFSKNEISQKEQEYIHASSIFWIGISCINILCHLFVFMNDNMEFWVYYSSFGWYFIFIFGGILQFLHRKFVFLKVQN